MSDLTVEKYYELYNSPSKEKEYHQYLKELSNCTNSTDYFKQQGTEFHFKRKKLHDKIFEEKLKQFSPSKTPKVHFLLGSIGSGKTSTKDCILNEEKALQDFLYINFDDLKKQLPEYEILKQLNPKKAASFVQSESAKLAGKLFKKSIQKKYNIMLEKNITKRKEKIHLEEEIDKTIKANYDVNIHIVFLDSYEEALQRVKKRAEEIKRVVPDSEVQKTFQNLFPYFNIIHQDYLIDKSFSLYLWYNGKRNHSNNRKEAIFLGFFFNKGIGFSEITSPYKVFQYSNEINNHLLGCGAIAEDRLQMLPENAIKELKKMNIFKK